MEDTPIVPSTKSYRYSEIFGRTIQGEGKYTGKPTAWIRLFGCNFECRGFSQANLDDPSTWIDPLKDLDVTKYKSMEELPLVKLGCDSSFSWSKKVGHLAHKGTPAEITAKIRSFLPGGTFIHPKSGQHTHMAFTGGEPMMSQSAVVDIMYQFHLEGDTPINVTVETNGTQMPRKNFETMIDRFRTTDEYGGICQDSHGSPEWFWSVSPKLYTSGEKWENAIKPEVVAEYARLSNHGQLKYVVDGSQRTWDEVERATELYRAAGVNWEVWAMPVGSTNEQQMLSAGDIAEQAIDRGYNVSARVHCYLWGNRIGK